MNIFVVTTVVDCSCTRPVAWTLRREDAERIVLTNSGDIHEGTYTYAVIEEIPEGLYPRTGAEYWFQWRDRRYTACDKPEQFKVVVNFAIG